MIIWTGRGFVVAVYVFLCALAANYGFDQHYGKGYYSNHGWAVGSALGAAGLLVLLTSPLISRRQSLSATAMKASHSKASGPWLDTLFWIPVIVWSPLLIAIGAGIAIFKPQLG
jgi:hypothetical protein